MELLSPLPTIVFLKESRVTYSIHYKQSSNWNIERILFEKRAT